jgi:hypothetical protein
VTAIQAVVVVVVAGWVDGELTATTYGILCKSPKFLV